MTNEQRGRLEKVYENGLAAEKLNIFRGKMLMEYPAGHDIWLVFAYIDWLEGKLDNADYDDALGTEGWRHSFNHVDA